MELAAPVNMCCPRNGKQASSLTTIHLSTPLCFAREGQVVSLASPDTGQDRWECPGISDVDPRTGKCADCRYR
jgi:hypothetical protein